MYELCGNLADSYLEGVQNEFLDRGDMMEYFIFYCVSRMQSAVTIFSLISTHSIIHNRPNNHHCLSVLLNVLNVKACIIITFIVPVL
jgi:hypothetical protein